MEKQLLAWAAGFFDADGSVTPHVTRKAGKVYEKKKAKNSSINLVASVTNTVEASLDLLKSLFGGSIGKERSRPHEKPQRTWSLRSRQAMQFLEALLPYLLVKRQRALLGIDLEKGKRTVKKEGLTIDAVMEETGLARMTCYSCLNPNQQYLYSSDTVQLVNLVAERLGYKNQYWVIPDEELSRRQEIRNLIMALNQQGEIGEVSLPETIIIPWTAGFFDGEGTVSIYLDKRSKRSSKSDNYATVCQLPNTDKRSVEIFRAAYGGCVCKIRKIEGHRQMWVWSIRAHQALAFLQRVYPYLVIKKRRAEIGIELQESKRLHTKKITVKTVAEESGVALSTCYTCLRHGCNSRFSKATVDLVRAAAARVGYRKVYYTLPAEVLAHREALLQEIHALNKKGKPSPDSV